MDKVISKKEKKKEYNLNYLKKQKEQLEQLEQLKEPKLEVKNENDNIRDIVNKEMNFFFHKQKTQPQAIPPAIVLQAPPSNLKNKMLETLMITSLGLIPLIAKALYAIKFTNTSTDTQPKPTNTQAISATDLSYFN